MVFGIQVNEVLFLKKICFPFGPVRLAEFDRLGEKE